MNGITFAQRYQDARNDIMRKTETKALMKTLVTSEFVTMRVNTVKAIEAFSGRGWEIVSSIPLGRGAGITSYIMRKNRLTLINDLQAGVE